MEPKIKTLRKGQSGFTMVEILVALVLSLLLLTGVYNVFISQQKAYTVEDQLTELMQNVRVGMDFIMRDLRMAGYDPNANLPGGVQIFGFTDSAFTESNDSSIGAASSQAIYFTLDADGDGVIDTNGNERKAYNIADKYLMDGKTSGADGLLDTLQKATIDAAGAISGWQAVAENITALTFTYTYVDGDTSDTAGLPNNTDADASNDYEDIRLVKISITARTEREDADFTTGFDLVPTVPGTCRTRTLTAYLKPRNLGL